MNKKIILIYCGIVFLTAGLFIGTPFEFLNATVDRVTTLLSIPLFLVLFIFLFRQTLHIDKKVIKWLTVGLILLLALPYLWIGLWTSLISSSSYYPMYEDMAIYTNTNGDKIIRQWRETSGSIYDNRNRKVFLDCGQFRLSLDWSRKNMHGLWTVNKLDNDSTYIENFDNRQ